MEQLTSKQKVLEAWSDTEINEDASGYVRLYSASKAAVTGDGTLSIVPIKLSHLYENTLWDDAASKLVFAEKPVIESSNAAALYDKDLQNTRDAYIEHISAHIKDSESETLGDDWDIKLLTPTDLLNKINKAMLSKLEVQGHKIPITISLPESLIEGLKNKSISSPGGRMTLWHFILQNNVLTSGGHLFEIRPRQNRFKPDNEDWKESGLKYPAPGKFEEFPYPIPIPEGQKQMLENERTFQKLVIKALWILIKGTPWKMAQDWRKEVTDSKIVSERDLV